MLFQATLGWSPLQAYRDNPELWSFLLFFAFFSIFWSFLILTGMHKVQKAEAIKKGRNMLIALGVIMGAISALGLMRMGVSIDWLIKTGLLQVLFGFIGGFFTFLLARALFGDKHKKWALIAGIIFGLGFSSALFSGSRLGVSATGMWGSMGGLIILFLIGWGVVHAFKSWKGGPGGGPSTSDTERTTNTVNRDLEDMRRQLEASRNDNARLQKQLEDAVKAQQEVKKEPLPPLFDAVLDDIKDEGWLPPPGQPDAPPPPLPPDTKKSIKTVVDATKDKLKSEEELIEAWMNLCNNLVPKPNGVATATSKVKSDLTDFEKLRDDILKSAQPLPVETVTKITPKIDDATHKANEARGLIESAAASIQKDLTVVRQTAQGEQQTVQRLFSQLQPLFKELGDIADEIAAEASKEHPSRQRLRDLNARGRNVSERLEKVLTDPQYGLSGDIIRQLLKVVSDTSVRMTRSADQARPLLTEALEETAGVQKLIGTQLQLLEQQKKAERVAVASGAEIANDLKTLRDTISQGIKGLRAEGSILEAGKKPIIKGGWTMISAAFQQPMDDIRVLMRALDTKLDEIRRVPNPPQWVINLEGRLEQFLGSPVRAAIVDLLQAYNEINVVPDAGTYFAPYIAKVIDSHYDEYLSTLAFQIMTLEKKAATATVAK